MSKWEKVRLGDVCEINMGQSPESESYNQDMEGIPFYQGNADFGIRYPNPRYYCTKPTKFAHENQLLVSVRAPIGALNIAKETCCIGRGLAAISVKSKVIDFMFVYFFLKSKVIELNSKGTGSTFKAINKRVLEELLIPLPPIEVQKKIAQTLDAASELITLHKKHLSELDTLIRATFYDMFGDPMLNEKGWEYTTLSSVICGEIQNGLYKHASYYEENGTPILRIDSFYNGKITNLEELKRVIITEDEKRKYCLSLGDIVINRVNSRKYLGKCGLVENLLEATVYESNMMRFCLNQNITLGKYIINILLSQFVKNQILNRAKDSVNQSSINQQDVKSIKIPLPPLHLQIQFAAIVTKIEEQKALVQKAIDESQYLFDSLMSQYFE